MSYAWNKTWRKSHKEARYKGNKKYYEKHRYNTLGIRARPWSSREDLLLFNYPGTDPQLAKTLFRSVAAVQIRRCIIRGKYESNK